MIELHIHPNKNPYHAEKYPWVGNFNNNGTWEFHTIMLESPQEILDIALYKGAENILWIVEKP